MQNEFILILLGGFAAFTVYDMLRAARTAGGLAIEGFSTARHTRKVKTGTLARKSHDPSLCVRKEDVAHKFSANRSAAPVPGRQSPARSGSSTLVYLVGFLSPLIGMGLAASPLI